MLTCIVVISGDMENQVEVEEKTRLINQVLELQHTLEGKKQNKPSNTQIKFYQTGTMTSWMKRSKMIQHAAHFLVLYQETSSDIRGPFTFFACTSCVCSLNKTSKNHMFLI